MYQTVFSDNTKSVNSLDLSVLECFWSLWPPIKAARSVWYQHPVVHFSELFFDFDDVRYEIRIRQYDLDGKHWKTNHIHITKGLFNKSEIIGGKEKHIIFRNIRINGTWVCKIK